MQILICLLLSHKFFKGSSLFIYLFCYCLGFSLPCLWFHRTFLCLIFCWICLVYFSVHFLYCWAMWIPFCKFLMFLSLCWCLYLLPRLSVIFMTINFDYQVNHLFSFHRGILLRFYPCLGEIHSSFSYFFKKILSVGYIC